MVRVEATSFNIGSDFKSKHPARFTRSLFSCYGRYVSDMESLRGNGDGFIDMHELKIWEGGFFFMEEAVDKA